MTKSQAKATSAFHSKMARAFDSVGRTDDAKSARKAAKLAKQSATK